MTQLPSDAEAHVRAAQSARQRGDTIAEAKHLDAALAAAPGAPQVLNALGLAALAHGDAAAAATWFGKAADADPRAPELYLNAAKAHRLCGDDAAERRSLDAAIAIDQTLFMAWLRKAELHERLGERGAASKAWSAAIALGVAIEPKPDSLAEALAHGATYVADYNAALGRAVDEGLGNDLKALAPAERRRVEASIDHTLGRRRIYANHCAGMHFAFLPADEFFDKSLFPFLADIEAKTDIIRAELEALFAADSPGFRPYVQMEPGTPRNIWSELDGSLNWGAYFLWEYGVRNEANCKRCPQTAAALEALPRAELPGRAPSAFFSVLRPRSHIPPHTGVSNTRAIIHLPLIVPAGCRFRVGGEVRPWTAGEAFAFDDTIEHEAWNDSDELRAVLIFDVWNPHLTETERRLLQRFYAVADASGLAPDPRQT
jgi:aspartyl/asparaginyl beta-hydroxylase (cupin superfamily)